MVWKSDGKLQKSPTGFSLEIDDLDLDSYRSTVTAALIDKVLAKGLVKASFTFDYCTEEEAEKLMNETWKNPMNLDLKCPILGGKILTSQFRCARRKCELISTNKEEQSNETKWKISFSVSQKKKKVGQ